MRKGTIVFWSVAALLLVTVLEASALGGSAARRNSGSNSTSGDVTASVPEPSTLYAIGTGLALLGGAGWYIRRRK